MKKLIFLLLCVMSAPSFAERWFEVEVIVFKRNKELGEIKEQWPEPNINANRAVSIFSASALRSKGLVPVDKSHFQLNDEYNKLAANPNFEPLVHTAWRQNDGGRQSMPSLRFTAGRDFSSEFFTDGRTRSNSDRYSAQSDPLWELDGSIRVYVQHYLFIETNLVLHKPSVKYIMQDAQTANADSVTVKQTLSPELPAAVEAAPQGSMTAEQFLQPVGFEQKRRMRSGETHYLDHPLMGLIIKVTRI